MGLTSPQLTHWPRYLAGALVYFSFRTQPFHLLHAHLIWLIVNAAIIAVSLCRAKGDRARSDGFLALILLLPLSYSLGRVLAVAGLDYRFMFPSTLIVQVWALTGALFLLAPKISSRLL